MSKTGLKLNIPEGVVFQVLDEEAVLLNLDSGLYFSLNEVGTRFWQLLAESPSVDHAIDSLEQEFDVGRPTLQADVLQLIDNLKAEKLVEETG